MCHKQMCELTDNMTFFPSPQTFLIALLSFSIFVIFIYIKGISFLMTKKNLPPSPWKLPIIGNFHQLGINPNRSFHSLSLKHGPIMLLYLGSRPTLVVSSSEVAQEIMKTHDLSFAGRPKFTIPDILVFGSKDISLSPYGEYWRQLKSIVTVHLLSSTRVKSFRNVREEEVGHLIDMLGESRGSLVNMSAMFISLTNNIICRVVIGRKYDGLKLTNLLKDFLKMFTVFSIGSYIPWLSWLDQLSGLKGRAEQNAIEFDEFLENIIQEHIKKKKRVNDEDGEVHDIVDVLLNIQKDRSFEFTLSKESLKAIILDMFVGGSDTTFTSLEWTVSELVKHPRVMKKLQEEITKITNGRSEILEEDLEKMTYLKAVIKESLRLHAPLPLLLPRESRNNVKLMGYDIPKGTQVIINAWAIGRDPAVWDDPEKFTPERFLNISIDYRGPCFDWLPFGAGRRGCPGIQFSIVVMELTLANLVNNFNFKLPNGLKNEDLDMSEENGITLHRKSPLMVMASPRF